MQCEAGAISIGPGGFQTTDLDIRMFQSVEEQKRLVFLTLTNFGLMLGFCVFTMPTPHPWPDSRLKCWPVLGGGHVQFCLLWTKQVKIGVFLLQINQ